MLWEDARNYISGTYRLLQDSGEMMLAFVKTNEGDELPTIFSYFEDKGFRWLSISIQIGKVPTLAYQKLVEGRDIRPNGGFDFFNNEIWLRYAYPISNLVIGTISGAVNGNELSHCVYCIVSDAQYIKNYILVD